MPPYCNTKGECFPNFGATGSAVMDHRGCVIPAIPGPTHVSAGEPPVPGKFLSSVASLLSVIVTERFLVPSCRSLIATHSSCFFLCKTTLAN